MALTRKPRGLPIHNSNPQPIPDDAPKEAAKVEFAKRLQKAIAEKGWNQSELARRATEHMPDGQKVGRDSVSQYIAAKTFPSRTKSLAIAKALDIDEKELIPTRGVKDSADKVPAVDVRQMEDGLAWLRINQRVPWPIALKVLALVRGENADK